MSWQAIVAAVLGCFLSCPLLLNGQMTPSAPGSISSASAEPHYPEQAYLSSARYTNGFFGFSFELPADALCPRVNKQRLRRATLSRTGLSVVCALHQWLFRLFLRASGGRPLPQGQ